MEFPKLPLTHPLTWCLLIMSFNFPSSLGSISGHRNMLGRDRQLFCREKKQMQWDHGKGVFGIFTEGNEMNRGGSWLLPAPRTSQWSWTFPRCGPCVMDSGNRNAAWKRVNNLSDLDQAQDKVRVCGFLAWEIRMQSCSKLLSKWPGIWGSLISTPNHFVLHPKGQREAWDVNQRIPFPLWYTHQCTHTCLFTPGDYFGSVSHLSDPAHQVYWSSKVRDSQEYLLMLSHPKKDPGNHKGGVPLNIKNHREEDFSPSLVTLEFVGSCKYVAQGASCFEI